MNDWNTWIGLASLSALSLLIGLLPIERSIRITMSEELSARAILFLQGLVVGAAGLAISSSSQNASFALVFFALLGARVMKRAGPELIVAPLIFIDPLSALGSFIGAVMAYLMTHSTIRAEVIGVLSALTVYLVRRSGEADLWMFFGLGAVMLFLIGRQKEIEAAITA